MVDLDAFVNDRTTEVRPLAISSEKEPWAWSGGMRRRYGVFRRSVMTPFFHPYYINYGYNKVFFYRQLAQEKRGGVCKKCEV